VLGYWQSGVSDPALVIMPTGTGKTDTMVSLLVAGQLSKLLVLVPSDALRDQLSDAFLRLGVLQERGVVGPSALRPTVGRISHGFSTSEHVDQFTAACNVIVATPNALQACSPESRAKVLEACTCLFVDEAHHAPARTWMEVLDAFDGRQRVLFTATPFREDGQALPGRPVFRFPLREAQADGYFAQIDYRAVTSLQRPDAALADAAIRRLRDDRQAGTRPILMARAASIPRAKELFDLYTNAASDLNPVLLHSQVGGRARRDGLAGLKEGLSHIVVCVDMLGEGFDLPRLKILALHDPRQSLSPMIQLVGRITRHVPGPGRAAVFALRDPRTRRSPLRDLLREDADWNVLLHDITEDLTAGAEAVSEFSRSFADVPADIAVGLLQPKMSAIAYKATRGTWSPEALLVQLPADILVDQKVAVSSDNSVAWMVLKHTDTVRWGSVGSLVQTTYELIVMYFNQATRLLFIHGSDNLGNYQDLADAVLDGACELIRGQDTYRVLGKVDRLTPTNIGLQDLRDHFTRFSMHVGSDVADAIDEVDRGTKTQTHIATSGFHGGERVTLSASNSGRFWSMSTAGSLKAWMNWCDEQGVKLLDDSITTVSVLDGLVVPEDLLARPPYPLLSLDWPWRLYTGDPVPRIEVNDQGGFVTDVEFRVDDHGDSGPFQFTLLGPSWEIPYSADFESEKGLVYAPLGVDGWVQTPRGFRVRLADWLTDRDNRPSLHLAGDATILADDRLAKAKQYPPFDPAHLVAADWTGARLNKESQGLDRDPDSVQAFASAYLQRTRAFDVLIDDDRSGEIADLVGLKEDGANLSVTLVHCKYSAGAPGNRVHDLYEVCGQAVRSAKWRQKGLTPLLDRLLHRIGSVMRAHSTYSPFEVGDVDGLYRLVERSDGLIRLFGPERGVIVGVRRR
jgi:superfamily II DNA or RNA helicase